MYIHVFNWRIYLFKTSVRLVWVCARVVVFVSPSLSLHPLLFPLTICLSLFLSLALYVFFLLSLFLSPYRSLSHRQGHAQTHTHTHTHTLTHTHTQTKTVHNIFRQTPRPSLVIPQTQRKTDSRSIETWPFGPVYCWIGPADGLAAVNILSIRLSQEQRLFNYAIMEVDILHFIPHFRNPAIWLVEIGVVIIAIPVKKLKMPISVNSPRLRSLKISVPMKIVTFCCDTHWFTC